MSEINESTRIINLTEASEMDAGMNFVTDSSNGTRKVPITKLIDANLEDEYAAAPAKVVGDLKEELENITGISDDVKVALLQIASKVTYVDEHGQDYYDDLYDALYPPAELVRISCVYNQSSSVYDTDSLNVLKGDLVVTAHYSDSSTETVTNYTLTGTLTTGTSTITVTYNGKTTTFTVTVTHAFSVTNVLKNCTNSNTSTGAGSGEPYSATIVPNTYYDIYSVTVIMDGVDITSTVYDSGDIAISEVTGNIEITATAYIYSYDSENGTMGIYTGSSATSDSSQYPNRVMNNPYGNGVNRRSFFTSHADGDGLPCIKKTSSSEWEETDFYPIFVPPDATSVAVTTETTDTTPYIGRAEWVYSDGEYTRTADPGWTSGKNQTFSISSGTQYMTFNNKRNSSGSNYSDSTEITKATITFTR